MLYHLPTIDLDTYTVTTWGSIDRFLFRPGDRLQIGVAEHGDLVLLCCTISQKIQFGRMYAGEVLSEPHAKPMHKERWTILGSVVAVERPLRGGVLGERKWQIALQGAPLAFQLHFGSIAGEMDVVYLEELLRQTCEYTPQASIVVSERKEWAQQLLPSCPNGMAWFHLRRYDSQPAMAASYSAWQVAAKRSQRRVWEKRIELGAGQVPYAALPEMIENEESLAS